MSVVLLEYKPKHYDTLPPVLEAGRNAEPSGAIDALESSIGDVFIKHGVEKEFGIILLHNHFALAPTEILVQFGNSAVPWETARNKNLANVVPAAWRFVEDGLAPYEFTYSKPYHSSSAPVLSLDKHGKFLAELLAILKENKLEDVLGLVVLEDKDIHSPALVEIESGRSTIALDVDVDPQPETDGWIQVVWQFGTKIDAVGRPVVFKKHKVSHKLSGGEHGGRHLTTNK
ncbi:hypothetical protein SPI_08053 [Niveomyces insectorum RCEF 264]|uniref:Uncharacterized protein n=1 Tax=Niveomyces insectorum RCEF 264 TaxID=1081102 RepID=A0A167NRT4_9HYPO|nr:hypothetical protein SPI_08053 [Niveomyces insectorum RCEF 264]